MSNLLEVTREIKIDHDNVRDLFDRFKASTDADQKKAIANTLVREMAIHGDAEEISVYNHFAEMGLGNEAAHNKEEHAEVKNAVYEADTTSLSDKDFDSVIARAATTFLDHAREEEEQQFELIKKALSPQENDKMAKEFLKARTMVPTRPHPWAPQSGGIAQKAAGIPGQMMDKMVETAQGRQYVDLKYSHAI